MPPVKVEPAENAALFIVTVPALIAHTEPALLLSETLYEPTPTCVATLDATRAVAMPVFVVS
jgi:hypothetical protein